MESSDNSKAGIAIGLSIVSIAVALLSSIFTYSQLDQAMDVYGNAILSAFRSDGEKYANSLECMEFAASLSDADLVSLLAKETVELRVEANNGNLDGCLQSRSQKSDNLLNRVELKSIRVEILQKYNSYDIALSAVTAGAAHASTICGTVMPSFRGIPMQLLKRMADLQNKPASIADMKTELKSALRVANGHDCPS